MKIFSSEAKCRVSSVSSRCISSSLRNSASVLSTDFFSTLLTERKCGFLLSMTQQLGEMFTSQSVKAYKASSVLSDDTPGVRCTKISTFPAVLSSTFLTLIFPFSMAFRIESINEDVVFP